MKIIIETERLILREMNEGDAAAMYEMDSNPDVQRYTGDIIPKNIEEVQARIPVFIQKSYLKHGFGRWMVEYKPDNNRVIGWSGLKYLEEFGLVDLGYRFIPEYWGKGIATEAAKPVMKYGFEVLNLDKIIGVAMSENPASINILKKVGMRFDKMAPYDEDGPDVEWYSITKEAFEIWESK